MREESLSMLQRGIRAWMRDEETEEAYAAGCTVAEFVARVIATLTSNEKG